MESSAELLQLMREIREAQRELLTLMKAWEVRSEQRFRAWEKERAEYKERNEPAIARWREANELLIRQRRLAPWVGFVLLIFFALVIIGMAVGITKSMGLCN